MVGGERMTMADVRTHQRVAITRHDVACFNGYTGVVVATHPDGTMLVRLTVDGYTMDVLCWPEDVDPIQR